MTPIFKSLVSLLGAVVIGAAIYGAYQYPEVVDAPQVVASAAGSTFNTAKYAGIVFSPTAPGANATSSSVYNGDASDRYITGVRIGCSSLGSSRAAYTGAGLTSDGFTLSIATTSTSAPASGGSNLVMPAISIATTTGYFTMSSTTGSFATTSVSGTIGYTGSQSVNNVWAAGSYLTFTTNATNTATCTGGVDYIGS